jgi:hypothetical protein
MVKSFGTFPHLLCPSGTTEAHICNIRTHARLAFPTTKIGLQLSFRNNTTLLD